MISSNKRIQIICYAILITVLVGHSGYLFAAWSSLPSVNTSVCSALGNQQDLSAIADGFGGTVFSWTDRRSGDSNWNIYAQKLNAEGVAQWGIDGLVVCGAAGTQSNPRLIPDGTGGVIIVWSDQRSESDVYAQRINALGSATWTMDGVPISTAVGTQNLAQIISDGSGGAVICWRDLRNGATGSDIYVQRMNGSGVAQWAANGVALCTSVGTQTNPQIATDQAGGAVVVWNYELASQTHVYAQRINNAGTVLWTTNGVGVCTNAGYHVNPQIVADFFGGAIMCWNDNRSGQLAIYAQHLNSAGDALWLANGARVGGGNFTSNDSKIAAFGYDDVLVSWTDTDLSANYDVRVQRMVGGLPQWSANGMLVSNSPTKKYRSSLISDGAGGGYIGWTNPTFSASDVYCQKISPAGVLEFGASGISVCSAPQQQFNVVVTPASGGVVFGWEDNRSSNSDIYAAKVSSAGNLVESNPAKAVGCWQLFD